MPRARLRREFDCAVTPSMRPVLERLCAKGKAAHDALLALEAVVRWTTSVRPCAQPKVTSPKQATLTSVS